MNHFVFGIDGATKEQEKALVAYMKDAPVGYWHWVSGMWLVVDSRHDFGAGRWRDKLLELMPEATIVVLAVDIPNDRQSWATHANRFATAWLEASWVPPPR